MALIINQNSGIVLDGLDANFKAIDVGANAAVDITDGSDVVTTALTTEAGATVTTEDGSTFEIDSFSGDHLGSVIAGFNSTVIEGAGTGSVDGVTFNGGDGTLILDQGNLSAGAQQGAIVGFGLTDQIEVALPNVAGATYVPSQFGNTGTLELLNSAGGVIGSLELTGGYSGVSFSAASVSSGGQSLTEVSLEPALCFCRGTRLMTDHGEVAVEAIAIGDRLLTASGALRPVKCIGRRRYAPADLRREPELAPILIRQGALADGIPHRDLLVSAQHALAFDGILIDAFRLVNGVSILRQAAAEPVEYLNVELETHDVILAEGAEVESFVDHGGRRMFDNWREYAALYPDDGGSLQPFCAPRLEAGYEVEAVRRRLDARAGIVLPRTPPGLLFGHLDLVDREAIAGWAVDAAHPDRPVELELLIDGKPSGGMLANQYRADLERAGQGHGRLGFRLKLPPGLAAGERHVISVRRAADGTELTGSPCLLEAAASFDVEGQRAMEAALDAVAASSSIEEIDRAIEFMLGQADQLLQTQAELAGGHRARQELRGNRRWTDLAPPQHTSIRRAA